MHRQLQNTFNMKIKVFLRLYCCCNHTHLKRYMSQLHVWFLCFQVFYCVLATCLEVFDLERIPSFKNPIETKNLIERAIIMKKDDMFWYLLSTVTVYTVQKQDTQNIPVLNFFALFYKTSRTTRTRLNLVHVQYNK